MRLRCILRMLVFIGRIGAISLRININYVAPQVNRFRILCLKLTWRDALAVGNRVCNFETVRVITIGLNECATTTYTSPVLFLGA
jgi:hypothetical protein